MFEKLFGFISPFDQGGRSPFGPVVLADFTGFQLIEDHVRHNGACFFSKRFPVMVGPHDFIGRAKPVSFSRAWFQWVTMWFRLITKVGVVLP
jgi:hypothetical protein